MNLRTSMRLLSVALAEKLEDAQGAKQRKLLLGLMVALAEDRNARLVKISKGMFTLVDRRDFNLASGISWCFDAYGYATGGVWMREEKKMKGVKLHRLITGARTGLEVDHKNCNTLDNRRSNLRVCTRAENSRNIGFKPLNNNMVGIKGVFYRKDRKKYRSVIWLNGKPHYCGTFNDAESAATARRVKLIQLHGEFANFEDRV